MSADAQPSSPSPVPTTARPAPYARPTSLAEALALRAAHPEHVVLAGGTDLLVDARNRPEPAGVLDLFGLPDLVGVATSDAGDVRIGAATTYAQLLRDAVIGERLPALWAACREVGALQIQARGTLGGNVATSSPVGDTLPVLLALDAEVELASAARGPRRVPYAAFLTGYRKIDLAPDELIVAVHVPAAATQARQFWRKVGTRRAQAISKVMLAAAAHVNPDGTLAEVRLALGAVADRPIRAHAVEALLEGARPDEQLAQRAAAALAITPIDDVRSTATYRLQVAQNLVARFVRVLAAEASRS